MPNLLFRADGNAQIGMGHVMRCLALARMLKADFQLRFAITSPAPNVQSLIEEAGLSVISLPENDPEKAFLKQTQADDIVVLDGYAFGEDFQRAVRERAKKIVFIDDLLTGHQVADVVVNHAGGVRQADYDAESYTQFCLGPHYALLRPEFLRPEGFGDAPADGPVFVSLGGADPHNVSLTVLQALHHIDPNLSVNLILGPFHPNRPAIDTFRSKLPNLTILQNLTAADMVQQLTQCSLAITACSTVSYEVCAVNRPLIGIVTADNQDRLTQFLSDEKLALSVHFPVLLSRMKPVMDLEQVLRWAVESFQFSPENVPEILANQRRFFDGRSPERFRSLFEQLAD